MKKKTGNNQIALFNNQGTTLVEMLVCFVLLAIFLVAAFSIITHISSLYFQVKGETYGKQVSDILMEKIQSEIEGAKFDGDVVLIGNGTAEGTESNVTGSNITLYDKTNTRVMLYTDAFSVTDSDKVLKIKYYGFTDSEDPDKSRLNDMWAFDKKMYNGYKVKEMRFIKASAINNGENQAYANSFGITDTDGYGDDTIVVFLTLDSSRYGEYKSYRFVRMYNYQTPAPATPENP